jgi:hypothetical protein
MEWIVQCLKEVEASFERASSSNRVRQLRIWTLAAPTGAHTRQNAPNPSYA